MKNRMVLLALAFFLPAICGAAEGKGVKFGGFVDTYYGFDFNQPASDRQFTTQAVRHNEFSVNLAYVEAKLEQEKVHGRLALQVGSSVYSNYSAERRYGVLGGPQLADVSRHIQEAYAGYLLAPGLWLDAGIFLSHIGVESFLSKDNWNYTRSLAADYSPYYQAGIRMNYQVSGSLLLGLHLLNGWQNTIETNGDKAVGMQIAYTPSETFSLTYNNFIGREAEFRFFNNFIAKAKLSSDWSIAFSSDVGIQKKPAGGTSAWFVETLLAQYRLTGTWAIGGRAEYFHDKDQVIVATATANGFQTFGGSLNLDWQPESAFLFRNEIRSLFSKDAVFSGKSGAKTSSVHFVTSLALSL